MKAPEANKKQRQAKPKRKVKRRMTAIEKRIEDHVKKALSAINYDATNL